MNFVYVDGHRGGLLLGQVGAEGSRKHGARCRCGSRQDIASSVRRVLDGRARRHPHPSRAAQHCARLLRRFRPLSKRLT